MVDPADFAAATRGGRRKGTPRLVVHVQTGGGTSGPLVGFVVPKRAMPHAVDRNLVKRRLRHIMRDRLPGLPADSRVVIRALAPAAAASYRTLDTDLAKCLTKLFDGEETREQRCYRPPMSALEQQHQA